MSEDNKSKKTLSLKLGTKRPIPFVKSFEAGRTVVVEKKRFRRNNSPQTPQNKQNINNSTETNNKLDPSPIIEEKSSSKSGIVLKPLSKDEQKKILKADNKEEKNKAILEIRGDKNEKRRGNC